MELLFCVPCLFGLEGLCADELKRLNQKNVKAENGRVLFTGDENDIAKANINIRTGERILLVVGMFNASTFDELFEGVRAMQWRTIYLLKERFLSRVTHWDQNFIRFRTARR